MKIQHPKWIRERDNSITLSIRVTPRASFSEICGAEDEWLKVRLKAAPVDGKANKELIAFFAKTLKVSKSSVQISSGANARLKRISIKGIKAADILNLV